MFNENERCLNAIYIPRTMKRWFFIEKYVFRMKNEWFLQVFWWPSIYWQWWTRWFFTIKMMIFLSKMMFFTWFVQLFYSIYTPRTKKTMILHWKNMNSEWKMNYFYTSFLDHLHIDNGEHVDFSSKTDDFSINNDDFFFTWFVQLL